MPYFRPLAPMAGLLDTSEGSKLGRNQAGFDPDNLREHFDGTRHLTDLVPAPRITAHGQIAVSDDA